jgi:isopentenyl-diphosphate delta-isomerase
MKLIDQVVLVDEFDNEIGCMEKMEAHRSESLHRAFSVFLFDSKGRMLLQQRAMNKYHSPGLWTNTCCSHPMPGESVQAAANRRLMEEMGIQTSLTMAFNFIYKAKLDQGLTEHELDYVLIGKFDGEVYPNSLEVSDYLYEEIEQIKEHLKNKPEQYTVWFKIAFSKVLEWYQNNK